MFTWVEKRWNSTIDPKWKNCLYNGQLRTSCRTRIVIIFQRLLHRNQRISQILPVNWKHHQIQWRLEVTSEHAGNRCRQILTSKPREAVVQHTKKTRWTRIQRKAFPIGYSPSQIIQRTWRRTLKERSQIRKVMLQTWRHKNGSTEGSIPRAEKFGDLITADHKAVNEGSESRNNHRYAVVVQDLATQWIQSSPCENKNSQKTEKSLRKFLEPSQKPKVIYTDISLRFGKSCEELSWNHRTSTLCRSETNGIAERAKRRVKEGTSAVLSQSGLDDEWWSDSMECFCFLINVQDLLADGKTPYERRFGESFKGPVIPFGALVEYLPSSERETKLEVINSERKYYQEFLQDMLWSREEFGKETLWLLILQNDRIPRTHSEMESTVRRKNLSGKSQGDREEFQQKMTQETIMTFSLFKGIYLFYRHHIEPRVQFFVLREESFPIPLKYIDVIRPTHTDLDVAQEKRVDDCWNVDGYKSLSDSWTGFTRFTLLNETLQRGFMWSGEKLTKIQTTSRPDHI